MVFHKQIYVYFVSSTSWVRCAADNIREAGTQHARGPTKPQGRGGISTQDGGGSLSVHSPSRSSKVKVRIYKVMQSWHISPLHMALQLYIHGPTEPQGRGGISTQDGGGFLSVHSPSRSSKVKVRIYMALQLWHYSLLHMVQQLYIHNSTEPQGRGGLSMSDGWSPVPVCPTFHGSQSQNLSWCLRWQTLLPGH